MEIIIDYNGSYPNLCGGDLIVIINGKKWEFPDDCIEPGGSVIFDEEWNETVNSGPWSISEWPTNFPEDLKSVVLEKINDTVEWGCCGGCV